MGLVWHGQLASKVPAFLQVDLDKDPFAALLGVSEAERGKIVGQAHMLHLLIQMVRPLPLHASRLCGGEAERPSGGQTMLALHRPYFIEAVKRSTEPEPETSFDACIRAAKKLTDGLKSAKRWIPKPSVFWKSFVVRRPPGRFICLSAKRLMGDGGHTDRARRSRLRSSRRRLRSRPRPTPKPSVPRRPCSSGSRLR